MVKPRMNMPPHPPSAPRRSRISDRPVKQCRFIPGAAEARLRAESFSPACLRGSDVRFEARAPGGVAERRVAARFREGRDACRPDGAARNPFRPRPFARERRSIRDARARRRCPKGASPRGFERGRDACRPDGAARPSFRPRPFVRERRPIRGARPAALPKGAPPFPSRRRRGRSIFAPMRQSGLDRSGSHRKTRIPDPPRPRGADWPLSPLRCSARARRR